MRNEKQLLNSEFSRILNQLDYFDEKTNKKLTKKQDLFGLVDKLVKFWIHFSWKKVVSSSCSEDYLLKKKTSIEHHFVFCFLNHKMYIQKYLILWNYFVHITLKQNSIYMWRSVNFKRTFWCHRLDQKSNFVGFLVQTMTSKSPFEINWPLEHTINTKTWRWRLKTITLSTIL